MKPKTMLDHGKEMDCSAPVEKAKAPEKECDLLADYRQHKPTYIDYGRGYELAAGGCGGSPR